MIGRRLYRLRPWVVRALIPPGRVGSYTLYDNDSPHYNGRSDFDLAGRLAQHARAERGDYFSYDVHGRADAAYLVECAGYHLRIAAATTLIHPAAPRGVAVSCPFCRVRGLFVHPAESELRPASANTKET